MANISCPRVDALRQPFEAASQHTGGSSKPATSFDPPAPPSAPACPPTGTVTSRTAPSSDVERNALLTRPTGGSGSAPIPPPHHHVHQGLVHFGTIPSILTLPRVVARSTTQHRGGAIGSSSGFVTHGGETEGGSTRGRESTVGQGGVSAGGPIIVASAARGRGSEVKDVEMSDLVEDAMEGERDTASTRSSVSLLLYDTLTAYVS